MLGLDTRATMDMDMTIKETFVDVESINRIFSEIISIALEDNITFELQGISEIREDDEYPGYRVSLTGNFPPMSVPLKLDITTGDKVTPREIEFEYKLLFEEKSIPILAYNIETILAEKLETIISRGDQSTRLRDYYDVYILKKLQYSHVNKEILKQALIATSIKRETLDVIKSYAQIITTVKTSETMNKQWGKYQASFDYAKEVAFVDACDAVLEVLDDTAFDSF